MLTCILLRFDFLENIRLMNGMSVNEGRVQMLLDGVWGIVCNRVWRYDIHNARVACRQLGFSNISGRWRPSTSKNMSPRILEDLNCTGNEQSILNCSYSRATVEDFCSIGTILSVICLRKLHL